MPTLVTRPVRRPPKRQRTLFIFLALLGALLVHVLLFLAVIWIVPHWPRGRLRAKSRPIELTMLSPTLPAPEPSGPADAGKPTPPPYIRTTDDMAAEKPPDDPAFISSEDTNASSLLAANGNKPLPTQDGKNVPAYEFEPRPYRLGTQAADAATSAPAAQATPLAAVSTPAPTPPPENKKPPLPGKNRPTHKSTAQATPATGDLAMPKADDSPSPEPPVPTPTETPVDEANNPPIRRSGQQPPAPPTNPSDRTSTGAPKPPGYQPQSIPSKMTGNINNRGKSVPSAIGTPLGRYEKTVSDAIGMLWYMYAEQKADVVSTGTVKIHFYVDRDGHVKDVRFTAGNANGALGGVSLQAINEAEIEPIPPGVADTLDAGRLEVEYSFSYY